MSNSTSHLSFSYIQEAHISTMVSQFPGVGLRDFSWNPDDPYFFSALTSDGCGTLWQINEQARSATPKKIDVPGDALSNSILASRFVGRLSMLLFVSHNLSCEYDTPKKFYEHMDASKICLLMIHYGKHRASGLGNICYLLIDDGSLKGL